MKKIFTFLLTAVCLLSLTACGQSKLKTVTLQVEDSGVLGQYVLAAEGDEVKTITQSTTMDCTGFVEDQFAIVEEAAKEYEAIYNAIEGVAYTVNITETEMVEVLTIDATNMEALKALSDQGLMPIEFGDYISLQKTVESLCADGWTVSKSVDGE